MSEDKFTWIDPTLGYPDDTLKEGIVRLEGAPFFAVRYGAAHKTVAWFTPIQSTGLEQIDGHTWELYRANRRGVIDGREYVWGMFVEGMGWFDVMVPTDYIRELTDNEKAYYSGRGMQMVGSHTGKVSYGFSLPEIK